MDDQARVGGGRERILERERVGGRVIGAQVFEAFGGLFERWPVPVRHPPEHGMRTARPGR